MFLNDESYSEIIDNINDGVYIVDHSNKILSWNKAAEIISGYKKEEVIGKRCSDNILVHVDKKGANICLSGCPLKTAITKGCPVESDVFLHHKQGYRIPITVKALPIKNRNNIITGAVEIFKEKQDTSAMIAKLEELKSMAFFDTLTQIGNRRHAEIHLNARFNEFKRYKI